MLYETLKVLLIEDKEMARKRLMFLLEHSEDPEARSVWHWTSRAPSLPCQVNVSSDRLRFHLENPPGTSSVSGSFRIPKDHFGGLTFMSSPSSDDASEAIGGA